MLEIVRVVPINQRMIPMLPTYVARLPRGTAARQHGMGTFGSTRARRLCGSFLRYESHH
eukprot:COSAG02_NODE_4730_length_5044_cov_2.166026_5_plen_59_part_00